MPDYLQTDDRWYEEDCDWARVYCVFATEIIDAYRNSADPNAEYEIRNVANAKQCLKNWCPDGYEQFFGEVIPAGESYVREHPVKCVTR